MGRIAQTAEDELGMGTALLVALEGGGVKNCGMTALFVCLEALYLLAAAGEM